MTFKRLENFNVVHDDKVMGEPIDPNQWNANFKVIEDAENENIDTVNQLLDDLESTANAESGADKIGATPVKEGGAETVQGVLEELQQQVDSADGNFDEHIEDGSNPHSVTKTQVGLGNVDNTSDVDKPVSTLQQVALNNKVDKTTTVNSNPLSSNVTLTTADVADNSSQRYVTDTEKSNWNSKWNYDENTIKNVKVNNASQADNASTVNGKTVLTDVPSGAVFTDTVTDVIDNLTSTDTDKALSAKQGKILKDNLDTKWTYDEDTIKGVKVNSSANADTVDNKSIVTTLGGDNTTIPTSKAVADAMSSAGAGDMLKSIYDPNNKNADAFSMDNMVEGTTNKVFTSTEKTKLAGIAANANNYTHPTTAGNKHIPSGGSNGKILGYDSDGAAKWIDPPAGVEIADNLTETVSGKALDATQGKELANLISTKAGKSTIQSKTLASASWTNGQYTYSNAAITATNPVELLPATTITTEQLEALQGANIIGVSQAVGSTTFQAMGDIPTIDIPVTFIIRGDL